MRYTEGGQPVEDPRAAHPRRLIMEGNARRVTIYQARRHFENGGTVLVSERGHEPSVPVTRTTTVHSRERTTWDDLTSQVRMWRKRYPSQRYYIVERD